MSKIRIRITDIDDENRVYTDTIAENIIGIAVTNRNSVSDSETSIGAKAMILGNTCCSEIKRCMHTLQGSVDGYIREKYSSEMPDELLEKAAKAIKAFIDEFLGDPNPEADTAADETSTTGNLSFKDFISRRFDSRK